MKYKWIELYGYAGIYNGMKLMDIKIDFTKCKTNKIIIKGDNGSGKSTLENAINPNPDSNDNFIPNCEARKNICLCDNGIDYIIRYIHPINNNGSRGTTKGYISKIINGQTIELNPNGNISSCKDILYDEFNLDSNFISLSKLSSENRGLVDNRPADRKKLVNSIINILEVYNGIYKKLSKKSSTYKQLINSITYKIDNLGNELQLKSQLENIISRINKLENERDMTIEAIATVKIKISEFMNILKNNNYDSIVSELKDVSSHNKVLRNQILKKLTDLGIKDINSIEEFLKYIEQQISISKSTIANNSFQVSNLLSQREIEFNDLKNKQIRLDSLQSDYNYLDIKNAINQSQKIVSDYEKIFNEMGLKNISLITKTEYDSAMESLKYLKDLSSNLLSLYNISDLEYVINNIEYISSELIKTDKIKNEIDYLKSEKERLFSSISIYISKQDIIDELNNRPNECKIDTCPYIKSALEASIQYPRKELEKLQKEYDNIENEINKKSNYLNKLNIFREILISVLSIKRELDSKINFILKLPVKRDFKETFFNRILSYDSFDDITKLYGYIDCGNMIEEYKLAKSQLDKYQSEYKLYEAKNNIIESILIDIESLTKKVDKMALDIETINNSTSDLEIKLREYEDVKIKIYNLLSKINDDLKPSEEREKELLKIKDSLDVNSNEIEILHDNLNTLNNNLASVNSDIKGLSSEKEKINHSIILLEQYKIELQDYSNKYSKIEKIKYYSSPSTGIQTLFMQLYMNKIISTANSLLSLLFDGEFILQPFIINENEFRIPCIGSGLLHDDISSMSTAQKCMISMILSFSILNQSSTRYNVIMLDEIDGGLDTINRGLFIELLDNLMNMLHCEQCFMISHNNELNTSVCDLIILKNSSNDIYNGNIIWQY